MFELIVIRRVPTYDFVVRTDSSRAEVIAAMTAAMTEPTRTWWPWIAHLEGTVNGGVVTCNRRMWPWPLQAKTQATISAEIIPRDDGGTDVLVRAEQAFALLPGIALLVIWGVVGVVAGTGIEGKLGWLALSGSFLGIIAVFYLIEARLIARIFRRILSSITSAHPPAP